MGSGLNDNSPTAVAAAAATSNNNDYGAMGLMSQSATSKFAASVNKESLRMVAGGMSMPSTT